MSLLHTLLELGHSTSTKLELAYRLSPKITLGEETITESNLLEIASRHPDISKIEVFSKIAESRKTGADWEWQIIGSAWTLKLRVQAKRTTKQGKIKGLQQYSKTAPMTQIELLISSAHRSGAIPVYCLYCAESQQQYWTKAKITDHHSFETGCLLVRAEKMKALMPLRLSDIEEVSSPWHYLVSEKDFLRRRMDYEMRFAETYPTHRYLEEILIVNPKPREFEKTLKLPTIHDLNRENSILGDQIGATKSNPIRFPEQTPDSYFLERGIGMLFRLDVSGHDLFLKKARPTS